MKAGRELDAMIAEKVMGWVDIKQKDSKWYGKAPKSYAPDTWTDYHELPRYSEDIAAAWEVVEKLRSRGFVLNLDNFNGYEVIFTKEDIFGALAVSDSLPLGICEAALKVVGWEEE